MSVSYFCSRVRMLNMLQCRQCFSTHRLTGLTRAKLASIAISFSFPLSAVRHRQRSFSLTGRKRSVSDGTDAIPLVRNLKDVSDVSCEGIYTRTRRRRRQ